MSDLSTPDPLATVKAALEAHDKATPGPWRLLDSDPTGGIYRGRDCVAEGSTPRDLGGDPAIEWLSPDDPAAIVALHNAAPAIAALVDEVERLRGEVDAMRFDAHLRAAFGGDR